MPKQIHTDLLDLLLERLMASGSVLAVCDAVPSDLSEPDAPVIAVRILDRGDYTGPADTDRGGRRITVKSQQRIRARATGRANHVVLSDGSRVLYATTCTPLDVRRNDKLTVPRWDIEMEGPE